MMRLPRFAYHAPRTAREAAALLAAHPGRAMLIAGGTDLLPNMKRRQQEPTVLIGLRSVQDLRGIVNGDGGLTIGAGTTVTDLVRAPVISRGYPGLWQAAAQIATPHIRNMATLGGNLCLDTRCNYYDQTFDWRKSIDFCMKKDGQICWVATSSPRCLAVSSTDLAPMLIALGASVTLADAGGERTIPLAHLYRNDGINYLTKRPEEIVLNVTLARAEGWRSAYWKLRRRGSFDFPVLSVAVAVKVARAGEVEEAHVVLGGVASCPVENDLASRALVGAPLTDAAIVEAAELAAGPARPMDNTDYPLVWRKQMTRAFIGYALRDVRGDDVRDLRRRVARQELLGLVG